MKKPFFSIAPLMLSGFTVLFGLSTALAGPPTHGVASPIRADNNTVIADPGGTIPQGVGVYFKVTPTDPQGNTVRMEVELHQLPATFTGTANYVSSYVSSGSVAQTSTATGLAAGNYGWAYRVVDSQGLASAWVPNDNPDFTVQAAAQPPTHGTASPIRADNSTVITDPGGTIPQGVGVYFKVTPTDPQGNTVRMEVELHQLPATFTGTANYVSSYVSSGSVAQTSTATGLAAGNYGWAYRVVDSQGLASAWVPNDNPDFTVQAAAQPPTHGTASPIRADNSTVITDPGGTIPQGVGVYFKVTPTDPQGNTVRMEVELHQLPATFTGTANYVSSYVSSGSVAQTSTATGLAAGNYGWAYRVVDSQGLASAWVPNDNPDFTVQAAAQPPTHGTASPIRADNSTVITDPGGTIPQGVGVYFKVTPTDPQGNTVRMEVELHQLPATFTGTANYVSSYVSSGSVAQTSTATGLAAGNYGWAYRVVDSQGLASAWVPNDNPDFTVQAAAQPPTHGTASPIRADNNTVIADPGGTIPQGVGVYFKVTPTDPQVNTVRMEVELHQLPATFTGTANYVSSYVSSGSVAQTSTATGLAAGNYGWAYRVVDSQGLASAWVPNDNPDFTVQAAAQPPTHGTASPIRADNSTVITDPGGTIPQGVGVYFKVTPTDPQGNTVRMEVELHQLPATFTGTANYVSSYVSSGSVAQTSTATGLAAGNYGWAYRVVDSQGLASAWVPNDNPDFTVQAAAQPPTHGTASPIRADNSTVITDPGGTIPQGVGVYFKVTPTDPQGNTVRMEVELHQLPATFTGTANYVSSYVSSGSVAQTSTATGLAAGNYGWAYRVVDSQGLASAWVPNDNPDFTVTATTSAPSITGVVPSPVVGANTVQTITINGANFVNQPTLTLTWPGQSGYTVPPAYVTFISGSQLQMMITTANDPSTWTVKATNPDGKSSSAFSFQVNAPVPAISGIVPTSANAGSDGITLTVNGTTFHDGSIVKANGNSLATTPHDTPGGLTTSLTATLPSSYLTSAGTVIITVYSSGPGGGTSAGTTFSVNGAQTPILSVTPANPPTQPATAGTITLNVANTGGGTMSYSASVTSGSSWLQISSGSSGGNSGTIVMFYAQNSEVQRSGTIQVTANEASGSPVIVTIKQAAAGTTTSPLLLAGKGDWIVYMPTAEQNIGVSTVQDLIKYEQNEGMNWITVKYADGNYSAGWVTANSFDSTLVSLCHQAGIKLFAWVFAYGGEDEVDGTPNINASDVPTEIDVAKQAISLGVDGLIIDAEHAYEQPGSQSPAQRATQYLQGIMGKYPNAFLAYSTFWKPSDHPNFPFQIFGTFCDAAMPQVYASIHATPDETYLIHDSQSDAIARMDADWTVQQQLWGASAIKPIVPGAYGKSPMTGDEITEFVNALKDDTSPATASGYQGVSFYDCDSHSPDIWNAIGQASIGSSAPAVYTVTPEAGGGGIISPSTPQPISTLGGVVFSASPATGSTPAGTAVPMDATTSYVVDQWLVNSISAQSGGTNFTLANVTADTAVQVTFVPTPPVAYTVTPSAGANGSISASDPMLVASGSNVTFTATPSTGYVVDQWLVNNVTAQSGSTSFTLFNVTAPTSVEVTFKAAPLGNYAITAVSVPTYGGTVNGSGAFAAGSRQAVTAAPAPGYSFINWTENGSEVSSSTNYGFTLTTNRTLMANFTATPFILSDKDAPSLLITQPYSSGIFVTTNKTLSLAGMASDLGHGDNGVTTVTVNGVQATGDSVANGGTANWSATITLKTGANTITVVAKDKFNNASQQQINVTYNPPDVTRPSIAITSPSVNQQLSASTVVVKGKASDNVEVANVFLQLNGGNWMTSETTNSWVNWTASVTAEPGTNVVRAYSEDLSGNMSPTNKVSFVYVVTSPLTLITNGSGKITRNFTGNILKVGSTYTVTAAPGSGDVFSNWMGTVTSFANPLTFVMQSNMVLQANFIPSPFVGPHGIYNGLFYTASSVTEETAGMLKGLNLGPLGTYSATILIGGKSYGISGGFYANGQTSTKIPRTTSQGGPLAVEMLLNLGDMPSQITGTVSGSNGGPWTANLVANRATNNGSAEYTMLLSPTVFGPGLPPGCGYMLMTNHAGVFTLSGALADGTSLSQTVPISEAGEIPVYDSLYGNTGLLMGWVTIAGDTPSGGLEWVKKASHATALYTSGFTNLLSGHVSLWTNAAAHTPAIGLPLGQLDFSGGNLSQPLSFNVTMTNDALVKLPGSPTNSLTGSINPKTGLLTVTFGDGISRTTVVGHGGVLQNTNVVAGFFLGKTNAGSIILGP